MGSDFIFHLGNPNAEAGFFPIRVNQKARKFGTRYQKVFLKRVQLLTYLGIDVLITHGPPKGFLDKTFMGKQCGCPALLSAVRSVQPLVHVFGHVHESYGFERDEESGVWFLNASTCNKFGKPHNPALIFDIKPE